MTADPHKRVLVVEDDPQVREMLGSLLRQRGLIVDEADGGAEAIELLPTASYSVILLDLLMPDPDGFAVLRALHAHSASSAPVVLVVTGADRAIVDRLDTQQIHGVIRKPFDVDELAALVVACTDIRSRGSFGMMAVAMISGARFFDLLNRLG